MRLKFSLISDMDTSRYRPRDISFVTRSTCRTGAPFPSSTSHRALEHGCVSYSNLISAFFESS